MSKATCPLKLPASVKDAAARLAREDGVSLNQWIAAAEKVGPVETAAPFLQKRAAGAPGNGLHAILARVPDVPPQPDDALDDESAPHTT